MNLKLLACLAFVLCANVFAQSSPALSNEATGDEKSQVEKFTQIKKDVDDTTEELKKRGQFNPKILGDTLKDKWNSKKDDPLIKQVVKKIHELPANTSEADFAKKNLELIENAQIEVSSIKQCVQADNICASDENCCEGLACVTVVGDEKKSETASLLAPVTKEYNFDKKCLKKIELGGVCEQFKSACKDGKCIEYSYNSTTLPICTPKDNKCKKNSECCSGQCSNEICTVQYRCLNCALPGQKPKDKETCCEGYYLDEEGKCSSDYPPEIPLTFNKPKKSIFFRLIDLIIPSAEAEVAGIGTDQGKEVDPDANMETCTFNTKASYFKQLYKNSEPMDPQSGFATKGDASRAAYAAARAFEFFYTGPGVNDLWKENGKSVFDRSKVVATQMKTARLQLEMNFKELDVFMSCNCLSFKKQKLTDEQKNFFKAGGKCENYATPLASADQAIKENLDKLDTIDTKGVLKANSENATKLAGMQTHLADGGIGIDKSGANGDDADGLGASGIIYREMMLQYLATRIELQAKIFTTASIQFKDLADISVFMKKQVNRMNEFAVQRDIHIKSDTRSRNWAQIIVDFVAKLFKELLNAMLWFVNLLTQLFSGGGHPRCFGAALAIKQDLREPWCVKSESPYRKCVKGVCVRIGTTFHTNCYKDEYRPNAVCGKNSRNAYCMKTAYKRTDSGLSSSNVYLIDPPIPDTHQNIISPDQGLFTVLDFNNKDKICSFTPQNYTDAQLNTLKALASKYAKDNDFYPTQEEQDAFANYAVQYHFLKPHTSKPRAMNYELPDQEPYYNDIANKFSYIVSETVNNQLNDLQQFINWGDHYVKTTKELTKNNQKSRVNKVNQIGRAVNLAKIHFDALKANQFTKPESMSTSSNFNNVLSGDSLGNMYSGLGHLAGYKLKQKRKLEHWMKAVGNTPKGQALLNARAAMQASQVFGGTGSGGNSGFAYIKGQDATGAFATPVEEAKEAAKEVTYAVDENNSRSGGSGRRRNNSDMKIDNEITDQKELDQVLNEAKSNEYDVQDGDSLWTIVTKAYVRGAYPHLLQVKSDLVTTPAKVSADDADEKSFAPTKSKKRKIKDDMQKLDEIK